MKKHTNKRILFLYAEVQAYTESVMHELVGMGYEIDLVYFDQDSHTPFKPMSSDHVSLYKLSEYNTIELVNVIRSMAPEIVYISGWQSIKYLICAFLLRLKHTKVVVGFDDQWHGTLKQQVGRVLAGLGVFKLFFSHAWVCGPYQYEYARKFGFKKEDIVFDLLTGDVPLFSSLSNDRSKSGDKIFIYVGRMSEEKGIFTLLDAWLKFRKHKNDWRLVMIGATEQTRQLIDYEQFEGVDWLPFMPQNDLVRYLQSARFAILPSLSEQWGVALHEYVVAGLPVLVSDSVGAKSSFLINGFNGFSFESTSVEDLLRVMLHVSEFDNDRVKQFSENSLMLGCRISPASSAYNFISVLD